MAVWHLNESRGVGGSVRVWKLSKEGDGLSVGRASYCDIQILVRHCPVRVCRRALIRTHHRSRTRHSRLQSQSVEKKHSIINWDQKQEGYIVHDLGSVDGVRLT